MSNIQYTIRNVPPQVDRVIKKRAKQNGKSFNQTVVDFLTLQTFGSTEPPKEDNFNWLFNTSPKNKVLDKAIKEISKIDEDLWK